MRSTLNVSLVVSGLLLVFLATDCAAEEKQQISGESPEMAQMRQKARDRPRRIIYNDDGCGPIWLGGLLGKDGQDPAERYLYGPHGRMGAVRGTQVDSVFICSGATHVLNHASSVAQSYADVVDRYGLTGGNFGDFRDNMRVLEARGTDAIQLTVDFCREQKIEVFYTHRINDIHLAFTKVERSTWWREHPQYWLGTAAGIKEKDVGRYPATDPKYFGWAALNFEMPQVRKYLLKILQDVANRYDVDGLEIDYLRFPLFFRSNLDLEPASKRQLDILTEFQRQVRLIAVRASAKRGRPMLVAVRVPTTIARCRYVGIDIEGWLQKDLVDVLSIGGGYVPFTMPVAEMVKLGHRHKIPVYPVLSASGLRGRYADIEGWRAAASNAWRAGADGIYLFNHFPNKPSKQFMELGDPHKLATMDKRFVIENNTGVLQSHYGTLMDSSADFDDPYSHGANIGVLPKSRFLPMNIEASEESFVILPIGDDLGAAANDGTLDSVVMTIQLSNPGILGAIQIKLNGRILRPVGKNMEKAQLIFKPEPSEYRVGDNKVSIRSTSPNADGKSPDKLTAVEVQVKYGK